MRKPQAYGAVVGAGSPANGPGLLANFYLPFTVAAAIVFAGKPAPTRVAQASGIRGRRRSGFTREWAGPAGQFLPAVHRCCRHRIRG
ncbi:hypothetical protein PRJ_0412 [Pseudomonas sp. XWY-1]|nr:hypothetical protein PRJ_0412 [Pseudomonas sp. XWY-1]